ncbi:MAG: nucleoside-triphosphatase [Sphaerochaetaceae bacterium]
MLKIITGNKSSGKSTKLRNYIEKKEKNNFFGFISFCNEERNKYWVKNIETGETWLLLWESSTPKYSRFDYDENVFKKVNKELKLRIKEELEKSVNRKIGVLDEVGRIELDSKGFNEGFLALLDYSKKEEAIIVIRQNFINEFSFSQGYELLFD